MWQAERAEAEAEEQRQAAAAAAAQQKKKQKKKRAAPALGLPPAGAAPLPSSGRVDTAAIEAQTRTQMCASAPEPVSVDLAQAPIPLRLTWRTFWGQGAAIGAANARHAPALLQAPRGPPPLPRHRLPQP